MARDSAVVMTCAWDESVQGHTRSSESTHTIQTSTTAPSSEWQRNVVILTCWWKIPLQKSGLARSLTKRQGRMFPALSTFLPKLHENQFTIFKVILLTPIRLRPCCMEVTIPVSQHGQSYLINIGTCLGWGLHIRNAPLAGSSLCICDQDLTSLFQVHLVADQ